MKNKPMLYLLIVSSIFVWGMIFYRVYARVNQPEEFEMPAPVQQTGPINVLDHSQEKYNLSLSRNPFNYQYIETDNLDHSSVEAAHKKTTVQAPIVNWPACSYTGYINNPKTNRVVALLQINGKAVTLNEGSSEQGITLLKNYRDSIKLSFYKQIRYFQLK